MHQVIQLMIVLSYALLFQVQNLHYFHFFFNLVKAMKAFNMLFPSVFPSVCLYETKIWSPFLSVLSKSAKRWALYAWAADLNATSSSLEYPNILSKVIGKRNMKRFRRNPQRPFTWRKYRDCRSIILFCLQKSNLIRDDKEQNKWSEK